MKAEEAETGTVHLSVYRLSLQLFLFAFMTVQSAAPCWFTG